MGVQAVMAEQTVIESGVIRVDASGRRQYSVGYKQHLATLALEPGASVAKIALAHEINALKKLGDQGARWSGAVLRSLCQTLLNPVSIEHYPVTLGSGAP